MPKDFTLGLYESWELNEASGNFIGQKGSVELVPNGVTQGQATLMSGGDGSCLGDGINDDIRITPPTAGMKFGTASFAIEIWAKLAVLNLIGQSTFFTQRTTTALGALFDTTTDLVTQNTRYYVQDGSSHSASLAGQALSINTVYQFVFGVNRTTNLLWAYRNASSEGTAVDTSAVLSISTTSDYNQWLAAAAGAFMNSYIQRKRIWTGSNSEFSGTDVTELYNSGSGLTYANLSQAVAGGGPARGFKKSMRSVLMIP